MPATSPQEQAPACPSDIHPSFYVADTALLLNEPWNTDWPGLLDNLHGKLEAHCQRSGLAQADPEKARYQVARGLFKAVAAPIMHFSEVRRAEHALPFIEDGEPADFGKAGRIDNFALEGVMKTSIKPPDKSFYTAREQDAAWTLGAIASVLQEIEDDKHGLHHVWQAYCAVLPEFCEAEMAHLKRPRARTHDAREGLARMGIENFEAITYTMLPRALQINRTQGLAGVGLVRKVLSQSESLAWFSSVARSFSRDKIIRPSGCPYRELPIYTSPDAGKVWALESLQEGPWPVHRSCAANLEMPGHRDKDCQTIDRVYSAKEAWTGVSDRFRPRAPGTTTAAELRLINTTYLLGRTIFANPPFSDR